MSPRALSRRKDKTKEAIFLTDPLPIKKGVRRKTFVQKDYELLKKDEFKARSKNYR